MSAVQRRWGAWRNEQGTWTFSLWAPAATSVELLLEGHPLPMQPAGEGWFQLERRAEAGMFYRYRIDGDLTIPDPASRCQPEGLFGPSVLVDHERHWENPQWRGRPWREAVVYEVHVGAAGGTYAALEQQLPKLAALGITALELMPLASFPGRRNWGYDGVLHYAPAACYGRPEQLKSLIDRAHGLGMMVLLDVVYNHFGPDGNPMPAIAPPFFRHDIRTPWGDAVDFREPAVQRYFIDNALMWLRDYRFDGLRLDAVHAIQPRGFLQTLHGEITRELGDRHVHLVLENEDNQASLLAGGYTAQWNDDFHNALHVLLTGEDEGYYGDHADDATARLCRVLGEGFSWQGECNRAGRHRGEPSGALPPEQFVVFAQNHDQIGNRALGERLLSLAGDERTALAMALTALTPMIPLFFLGEPWGETAPFLFFTDHRPPLDEAVREGRRAEFAHFRSFQDETLRARIPDPNAVETFERSSVAWPGDDDAGARQWLELFRRLLQVRADHLVAEGPVRPLGATAVAPGAIRAGWQLGGGQWWLAFNAGELPVAIELPRGREVFRFGADADGLVPPCGFVAVHVEVA